MKQDEILKELQEIKELLKKATDTKKSIDELAKEANIRKKVE
jgi:hypothetical protein